MLEKAFELAVVFSAVDRMTGPISSMANQLGILDERTRQVQQRMNEFKNMTFVGGAITAAGVGLAHVMEDGVRQANDFITKATVIKDTLGASADQMDRINKVIRESSGKTIFGVSETQDYAKLLATSGMKTDQVENLLPVFTQYAEVQKLGKGSDPTEAIKQAIGAAHTVGAYDPKELSGFLDKYNKATFMQPGSSAEFADTFKYMSSRTVGMKLSTDDMLDMSALANRMGLAGSIGGTEASDMILRTIPGLMSGKGNKDSKQTAALKEMGLADTIYDSNGQFKGVANLIEQLNKSGKKFNPEQFAKLTHDAFGQQGMGMAQILASDRGREQLDALAKQKKSMKSIGEMQEDTNQTPEGQMLQLKTNIENLKLDVWLQLAKILNPIFMWLNKIVSKVQDFSTAHPQIAKLVAGFLTFATATALVIGPLLVFVGVLGFLKNSAIISTGVSLIGKAFAGLFSPIGLVIMAIIGLIAGFIYLYNSNENFRKTAISAWNGIKNAANTLWQFFQKNILPIFQQLEKWIISKMPTIEKTATSAFQGIVKVAGELWDFFQKNILPILIDLFNWIKQHMPQIENIVSNVFKIIANVVSTAWDIFSNDLLPILKALWDFISPTFPLIETAIKTSFDMVVKIVDDVVSVFEKVTGAIKDAVGWLNNWINTKPDSKTLEVSNFAYAKAGGTPPIGQNANGTDSWRGGLTWVGEKGPELVNLPGGSQVIPNHKTGSYLNNLGSSSQQDNMLSSSNSSSANVSSGDVIIQSGAIVINPQQGQSPKEIADAVMQEIGRRMRNQSNSRSTTATTMW